MTAGASGLGGPLPAAEDTPIDYPQLARRLRDRETAIRAVLALFPDECAAALTELDGAIRFKRWDEAGDVAHRIKGAAGTVSAHALRAAAIAVEDACRTADAERVQAALLDLLHEAMRAMDHVQALIGRP